MPLDKQRLRQIVSKVRTEIILATSKYGKFKDSGQAYCVIAKELCELHDEIFLKHQNKQRMEEEALQVAAMVIRFIMDVC